MGTRAAAFTAKIRNLSDFHMRLTNGVMPLPTGLDVSNTLKHFSQTLLVVLKDVPNFPLEMLKSRNEESARMQLFPNLDYKSLFTVVVQLIDVAPLIQVGIQTFGQHILQTIACLLPFLEHEQIDTLPYTIAASLGTFPASLHKEIIDVLCYYIFPFTIYNTDDTPEKALFATQSVSAVLMMVFQHTTSSEYHCQVLESVMRYKRDAIKDLLCVVAYGTLEAKNVAVNLLVYYWPHHNPTLYDRRNINFKFSGYKVPSCKSEMCSVHNTGGLADATKVCYDHSIGISLSPENPPPLFLCQECASRLQSEQPGAIEHMNDVAYPISRTGTTCDNKNCRSQGPEKIMNGVICFHYECASYNGNRPIRYCQQCHSIRHNNRRGADHVVHFAIQPPSQADRELMNYHVEAIVSLLLEAEPLATRGGVAKEDQQTRLRLFTDGEFTDPIPSEERRLMGRFGIWLLVGFFNAEEEIPKDILCRLLSSLFQWFNTTAYIGDDPSATVLERLKVDNVCPWLKKIIKKNFDTFVTCLLPHPPDFARVGGHWDIISSRTFHLKEGFNRLFCLVPYDVISAEIWSQIMPNWMESMASEVPEEEMAELKIILSKVMDPEMNPLGFDARQMYQFIAVRFHQTSHKVKEQALRWLQVLSKLEIVIPLYFIFSIFREGIRPKADKVPKRGSVSAQSNETSKDIAAICQDDSPNASSLSDEEENFTLHTEQQSDSELMLSSFIFMLDIILKQLELQEVEQHKGLQTLVAKDAMTLLHNMVAMPWPGTHTCQQGQECQFCEMSVLWYQLALEIVEKLSPFNTSIPPDVMLSPDGEFGSKSFPEAPPRLDVKPDTKPSISPKSESMGLEGIIVNMPQILTATVETCSDMDLAPIIPSEKVVKAVARAVTITESDTASATAHIASSGTLLGDELGQTSGDIGSGGESEKDFWSTSVGKFKFCIEELPPYLQFTFELLKKIPDVEDPELMEYLLKSLKIMFLHEEVLLKAAKEYRGFVIWCQENLLIKNLWELMDAEFSQLCEHAVPILLHCVTLPVGADVFWKQIEDDFQSPDWRHRFTAVERVVQITRFMDAYPVKNSQSLQTALANAFCYTISSLDDPHVAVAQRAALYLGTINDSALQSLMYCLESQFDSVIIDRPVILQSLYLLINSVSDRKILRWDFFLNCFDSLFLEAQITLERMGEISFSKDVRNIDGNMDSFIKKLARVQEALSRVDSNLTAKTLYSSLGTKWPYKRTMSAPAGFQKSDKERSYFRQSSAPVLKRKGSRHGIEGHIHGLMSGEEGNLMSIFHRIVELEENDKESIHLLVFLFMQFLSRYNRGNIPSENKSLARTQTAVLRHITMLLGYNPQDKNFFLQPSRIRSSPVFNSFISNLPQVLDQNFRVGATILPISLSVLHYSPAPSKSAGSRMHPSYSLWYLEPHVRRHWLFSLIVILYKYEYGAPFHPCMSLSSQVQTVMKIVLNTLNYQEHRCRPLPSTLILDEPCGRSRGDLEHITEHETPPMTPLSLSNASPSMSVKREQRKSVGSISSGTKQSVKKVTPESFDFLSSQEDNDDIEPELAAIPESPKSPESGEMVTFQEMVGVENREVVKFHAASGTRFDTLDQVTTVQPIVHGESPKTVVDTGSAPLSASSTEKSKNIWFLGGGDDSKSSSSGASTSSKSGGGGASSSTTTTTAKTEFPWHLSVQAAFQIAKIPAPPLERLLPVGSFNPPPLSPTVKFPSGRERSEYSSHSPYESPESPMSSMNMISLGPQVRVDESVVETQRRESKAAAAGEKHGVERLLSLGIGNQGMDSGYKIDDHGKGLHKSVDQVQSYGKSPSSTSPKKLVKQPHVYDSENVFDSGAKNDAGGGSKGQDSYKSVGFTPHLDAGQFRVSIHNLRQSSLRVGDDCIQGRCGECGVVLETYTSEELGLCVVALETFIHREPGLAAPLMPEILKVVTRIAQKPMFAWQSESSSYIPGGISSVAHQFLRCILHQLAPYGVFVQLFQTKFPERVKLDVFKSISISLTDFTELNPVAPLQMLLEALNARKSLIMDSVAPIIDNVASYLECLPLEAASVTWTSVIPLFEAFLRKILPIIQTENGVEGILRTMSCLLRLPGISGYKGILDPFSKILSFALSNVVIKYQVLTDLCHLCYRGFTRDREKLFLTRVAVIELIQAMKFKSNIPDANFLMLVTFVLQDSGGSLAPYVYVEGFPKFNNSEPIVVPSTGASECMRQHLTDSLEFLADFHSLSKIKSNYKGNGCGLNDDTLGGVIKGGISQFIALEISRGNSRENRAIGRHLPWLYNAPSAIQQGPKEFLDCVAHIRVLSWLLLGALTHTAMFGQQNSNVTCVPIPLEASCHVADHVHVIMTGFAEQSKASVLHMSSLFHAFILCQVWTVYLEQVGPTAQMSNSSDPANLSTNILTDFWGKVTPAILQLISHSKVLADMVNLHFLTLMESLMECNSSVFNRLLPLWSPVLYAHSAQLPSHVNVRLQTCLGYAPPDISMGIGKDHGPGVHDSPIEFPSPYCGPVHNLLLLKWVQRLQFKMAQIELQSSAATQFYPL